MSSPIESDKKMYCHAGYMEMGESSAEGAARETLEEANAAVEVIMAVSYDAWPHHGDLSPSH